MISNNKPAIYLVGLILSFQLAIVNIDLSPSGANFVLLLISLIPCCILAWLYGMAREEEN